MIELVSTNNSEEIARKHAQWRLETAATQLFANILRVMRGSGKPYEILRQLIEVVEAEAALVEKGMGPSWPRIPSQAEELHQGGRHGNITKEDINRMIENGSMAQARATDSICDAVARLIAARLLHQITQERVAENDLHSAINDLEEANERYRKSWDRP